MSSQPSPDNGSPSQQRPAPRRCVIWAAQPKTPPNPLIDGLRKRHVQVEIAGAASDVLLRIARINPHFVIFADARAHPEQRELSTAVATYYHAVPCWQYERTDAGCRLSPLTPSQVVEPRDWQYQLQPHNGNGQPIAHDLKHDHGDHGDHGDDSDEQTPTAQQHGQTSDALEHDHQSPALSREELDMLLGADWSASQG